MTPDVEMLRDCQFERDLNEWVAKEVRLMLAERYDPKPTVYYLTEPQYDRWRQKGYIHV